jgi:hypothetical protein
MLYWSSLPTKKKSAVQLQRLIDLALAKKLVKKSTQRSQRSHATIAPVSFKPGDRVQW